MKRKPLSRKEHDRMRQLEIDHINGWTTQADWVELRNLQARYKKYGDAIPDVLADILRF